MPPNNEPRLHPEHNNIPQMSGCVAGLGLIPKALKNSDSCCSYCKDGCSGNLFSFSCPGSLPFTDYSILVTKAAHPAVLIDGSQSLHGHISDMAPPEQDLSWKKVQKCMLERKNASGIESSAPFPPTFAGTLNDREST